MYFAAATSSAQVLIAAWVPTASTIALEVSTTRRARPITRAVPARGHGQFERLEGLPVSPLPRLLSLVMQSRPRRLLYDQISPAQQVEHRIHKEIFFLERSQIDYLSWCCTP